MRQEYATTVQIVEALEDNVKAVAEEAGWQMSYLYDILRGDRKDPYAPFRFIFRVIARAVPHKAQIFLDDLQTILNRAKGRRPANMDKLKEDAKRGIFEVIGAEIDKLPDAEKLPFIRTARQALENYEHGLMFLDVEDSEAAEVSTTAS